MSSGSDSPVTAEQTGMTNSIATKTSASGLAVFGSGVLGSAKQAFKAMAEAATTPAPEPAAAQTPAAPHRRRGTLLDRYA